MNRFFKSYDTPYSDMEANQKTYMWLFPLLMIIVQYVIIPAFIIYILYGIFTLVTTIFNPEIIEEIINSH